MADLNSVLNRYMQELRESTTIDDLRQTHSDYLKDAAQRSLDIHKRLSPEAEVAEYIRARQEQSLADSDDRQRAFTNVQKDQMPFGAKVDTYGKILGSYVDRGVDAIKDAGLAIDSGAQRLGRWGARLFTDEPVSDTTARLIGYGTPTMATALAAGAGALALRKQRARAAR